MGREWLYLYKATGGGGSRGGRKSPPATAAETMNKLKAKDRNTSSSGCMSVIFNLFDVHHHQFRFRFRFHHPSFMSDPSTITNHRQSKLCLEGIEAPRSSYESPEYSAMDAAPSSSEDKEKPNLNIPVGKIQTKTNRSRFTDEVSSECSSSPGTKTPNLVARLMGLDLLPEYSSPRPSSSSTPANSHHLSRSLPATPRVSTSCRRSTDNDYQNRLSLQIQKENCNRKKMARRRSEIPVNRQDDDLKTQYAKQITNQVRERISRRLGTDITNTISSAGSKDRRRDSDLVLLKPKKSQAIETPVKSKPLDSTQLAINLNKPISNSYSSTIKHIKIKRETPKVRESPVMKPEKPVKDDKIKRIASERYDLRLKKMGQKEVVFVSKNKSTTLPNHVLNLKNTTKILSLKNEMTSSSSTSRSSRLQMSLPNSLNISYKPDDTHNLKPSTTTAIATTTTTTTTTGFSSDHFDYISRILNQCGINSTTPISSCQWQFSHSDHPLHPSIFHQLETLHHPTSTTATRWMIFELVNDSLVEIFKPYNMNLQKPSCVTYGCDLIGKLCEMIGGFPAAHCEVLEDMIERDVGRSSRWSLATAFEAEGEDVVKEIESEIVRSLVNEIATETVAPAMSDRMRLVT
ncbi:hypothetical protein R6Q59_036866 [Mikania micrantha]